MGFWSSFFGAGAAHVYNEMKKEEKETQKWNDNLHMTMNYEEEFSNYLKSIGSNAVYISEVDESAASVRNQIDRYKRKIKEFLNLGGEGKYIYDVEELDEYIEVMKYLKSVGYVNRQQEFLGLDLFLVKDEIDRALREDNSTASLVNLRGNILNGIITKGNELFIPYDDLVESTNTIKIGTAKLYSEDTVQFLEYKTISLVFTETNIYIYSYELDEHSQLYCNVLIGKNQKLDITSLPIPAVEGWSMVVIDDLQILCDNSEAEKVMELYRKHNADIYLEEEVLQQTAAENINQLSGVEFERVCQQLVEKMGFETETTKASGDGGIDLIAYNHQPLLSGKYIIQCKRYTGSVGEPIIRDLYGVVMSERANKGILMTTGTFTKSAINFADGKPIELIDGIAMQNLFSQYGISGVSSNSINTELGVERVLNEKVREFFDEKWNEFETSYYTFGACLDDLVDTADLREKINVLDTVISGLKLYESYLMASKMPCEIQAEMFVKIIGIMDIGKYESYEAEKIYSAMLVNDDGLRDNIKKAVIPSEDYTAGMFWTYLVAASDEMQDYSYIKDLLQYHSKYIIALACCIGCFTDNDVFGDLRNYCEETHNLLEVYLSTK